MHRCLKCNTSFQPAHSAVRCTNCGWAPETVDGFLAYAPQFADHGGGFEAKYFDDLAALEANNFWFVARNHLLLWILQRYHPDFHSLLEIGCGTGFVLSGISKTYPHAELFGSEIFTAGLRFATQRLPNVSLMQMDARDIPFVSAFDVVGAFDVLEHIEEDEHVLAQIHAALKPNGTLLVSVPQHQWLWSSLDEYSCHYRRYSAAELHRKVKAAGFEIVRSTSFVSLLLPAMLASRLVGKNRPVADIDVRSELDLPKVVNRVFGRLMSLEFALIKWGLNLPLGGSRLLVARKV